MDIPGTLNVDVSLSESLNFSQLMTTETPKPNKSRLINNLQKIIQTVISSEISILKNIR